MASKNKLTIFQRNTIYFNAYLIHKRGKFICPLLITQVDKVAGIKCSFDDLKTLLPEYGWCAPGNRKRRWWKAKNYKSNDVYYHQKNILNLCFLITSTPKTVRKRQIAMMFFIGTYII